LREEEEKRGMEEKIAEGETQPQLGGEGARLGE